LCRCWRGREKARRDECYGSSIDHEDIPLTVETELRTLRIGGTPINAACKMQAITGCLLIVALSRACQLAWRSRVSLTRRDFRPISGRTPSDAARSCFAEREHRPKRP
jgi:hypothetical protein